MPEIEPVTTHPRDPSLRTVVRFAGVRPESCTLSKWVKGPPPQPGRRGVTESCVRTSNGGYEA